VVVIDVRNDWELEVSSLEFARQIVMDNIPSSLDEIPKDKPVVLICRTGNRSWQVANFLVQKGWDQAKVFNLEGGINGWAMEIDPDIQMY
jgi:rhodanese-related sulfurtransferase